MDKVVDVIGDDTVTNPRKRAADLGLRMDDKGQFRSFGDYMHAKMRKLMVQCNNPDEKKSGLFSGLSFYVDGRTDPPAHEIKELVTTNGGEYHHYYLHGRTTYQIAEALANTKIERLRKDEYVLKPSYVVDCIKENQVLPIDEYLLVPRKTVSQVTGAGELVQNFLHRSRLHLISTMAAEFKKFVSDMKANESLHEFSSRKKLKHLQGIPYNSGPLLCHIDMDCFFVSVALKTRPDLVGKPVVITHSSANSGAYGEISSCSYEARKKGLYARQLVRDALKLCPDLVCLPYQFDDYISTAKQLYPIVAKYTLKIKAISCDELYFDIGSLCSELNISNFLEVIKIIRCEIFEETKCQASAGLGPNWLLARLATKKAKPNGQFYIPQENAMNFIKNLSIEDLPAVGWSSREVLQNNFGKDIEKCGQLMNYSLEDLRRVLGVTNGEKVFRALRGKCDDMDFNEVIDRKSVSVNVNFGVRLKNEKDLSDLLFGISHELSERLRQIDKTGIHLTLKYLIRMPDAPIEPAKYGAHGPVYPIRKAGNLSKSTSNENLIHEFSLKLSKELNPVITDIRGVSLHINKLNFLNPKPVAKKDGKTLWDFVTMNKNKKNKISRRSSESSTSPKKIRKVVPEEMEMRISEVTSEVNHRELQTRLLGNLPEKPKIKTISSNNLIAMMIDNKRINIAGIIINYRKAPNEEVYRQVMYHFKRCIISSQLKDLKRMFGVFERYLTSDSSDENWKSLVAKSKRYLNWYCFKIFQRKLYELDDPDEVEKEEFETFLNAFEEETRKKQQREKSPELFGEETPSESAEDISPEVKRKRGRPRKKQMRGPADEGTPESRSGRASDSRSEKSPDFRDERASESRSEKSPEHHKEKYSESCEIILSQDESEEDCQIIETSVKKPIVKPQNQKTRKQEIKKQQKVNKKITDLIKEKSEKNLPKKKLNCSLINIDDSSSDDDCVILDPSL